MSQTQSTYANITASEVIELASGEPVTFVPSFDEEMPVFVNNIPPTQG